MIYSTVFTTREGLQVPLFTDGRPMHSKYNPLQEAEKFAENLSGNFFVIAGIGGGFHIQAILKNNPQARIIAYESSQEDLNFCLGLENIKILSQNKSVILCHIQELENKILSFYLPQVFGTMNIIVHRAWKEHNLTNDGIETAKKTLEKISADYSVQSHFGKMWQHNIFMNSLLIQKKEQGIHTSLPEFDTNRICVIVAAGPSLDTAIQELSQNRNKYCIIATDTGSLPLFARNIIPDAIVCVDAQNVSHTHFLNTINTTVKYILDISASPSIYRHLLKNNCSVYPVNGRHPLASYIHGSSLPELNSGSGTVTAAALDLAVKSGFKKIKLIGADFAYSSGKPYATGTYLDTNFALESSVVEPSEKKFTGLMYRTKLIQANEKSIFSGILNAPKTTAVMDSYKTGLLEWCCNNGISIQNDGTLNTESTIISTHNRKPEHDFLFHKLKKGLLDAIETKNIEQSLEFPETKAMLPYISWLKKNNQELEFFDLLKLAYNSMLRYTILYEN